MEARSSRAKIGTWEAPIAIMMANGVCPRIAAIDTASSRFGTERMMSTMRMMSVSTQPPNVPASRPRIMPPTRPIAVEMTPIIRDACAPQMSLDSTSPPKRSRPSGNCGSSPGPGM